MGHIKLDTLYLLGDSHEFVPGDPVAYNVHFLLPCVQGLLDVSGKEFGNVPRRNLSGAARNLAAGLEPSVAMERALASDIIDLPGFNRLKVLEAGEMRS